MNTTPDADTSILTLTRRLRNRDPFIFTKFGDGDLWWMSGKGAKYPNAYGERYTDSARRELIDAADTLSAMSHAYFGDQLTCRSGPYLTTEQAVYLYGVNKHAWLHFETLLIHRMTPALLTFYREIAALTPSNKVLCCGKNYLDGARILKSRFIPTDNSNAHSVWRDTVHFLAHRASPWQYLFLSCGRASKMIAARLGELYPDRTIIELGSALEPLIIGRTRSEQIDSFAAREYFKELL